MNHLNGANSRLESLRLELRKERHRTADLVQHRDQLIKNCTSLTSEVDNLRERIRYLEAQAQASGQLSARGVAAARAHLDRSRHECMGEANVKEIHLLRERVDQQVHRELLLDWHVLSLASELERCASSPEPAESVDSAELPSTTSTSERSGSDSSSVSLDSSSLTQTPSRFTATLSDMLADERVKRDAVKLRAIELKTKMHGVATELRTCIEQTCVQDRLTTTSEGGAAAATQVPVDASA